jgi:hypothetical protein
MLKRKITAPVRGGGGGGGSGGGGSVLRRVHHMTHLSLVDTCHVVGTATFLVSYWLLVNVTQAIESLVTEICWCKRWNNEVERELPDICCQLVPVPPRPAASRMSAFGNQVTADRCLLLIPIDRALQW